MAEEVLEEAAQLGLTLKAPLDHGILALPQEDNHIFRLEANIWFPQVYFPACLLQPVCIYFDGHVQLNSIL